MHELLFFYVARVAPTWEVTWFFLLQGACLVLEFRLKNSFLAHRRRLHWAVSGPLTIGFVMATADWLFFPPLVRNGVDARAISECLAVVKFLKEKIQWT
ncbi:Long-chain-alcohol O-fatty-acyltransferase [Morella rubra]|uniref:Long-chain-alcohol O-fatty-acyltransferase n=1 Tax=Morella rubra TaxID=262757 RepID=A0A6A1WNZ0_9ROSI|nr:Long-chain-alcohol O-fatty-acyltransferase [Morella rubra]